MDIDRIRPVRFLLRLLGWFRLWPTSGGPRPQRGWTNWQGYLLHSGLTLLFTVLLWAEAILSTDMEHTVDVLLISLTMTALALKVLNNWSYAHMAQRILTEWSSVDRFRLKTLQEVDMWRNEHQRFDRVVCVYIMCSVGVIPVIVIPCLFNIPNRLPFWMWTPFDWQQSVSFWFAFIYQAVVIPFICLCNVSMDLVNWYLMLHLSLCLRMLGQRLAALNNSGIQQGEDQLCTDLLDLVALHQRLKQQALDIEKFISMSTLFQILVSSLIICCTIYSIQMTPVMQDLGKFAAMIQYLLSMVMQILLPSIYSNEVTNSAAKLTDALYSSAWPDLSPRLRRLILMLTIYLNRPMYLRAGGFFNVGLPMFTKVINQAYSLLALLLNMNN
ncbi:putative odorant receptor 71a [Drosophila guanche]|uniref:Odorant receptor n=1 Tax=Drosophila guanche TaxID=7266 RepID=A0A3B0JQT3_DROGU|nr:putative odorant receptor 71a [Drosophila guanche]SPP76019.1 blast:Putative odorant receptor 71a [Drosophila guanche]